MKVRALSQIKTLILVHAAEIISSSILGKHLVSNKPNEAFQSIAGSWEQVFPDILEALIQLQLFKKICMTLRSYVICYGLISK